MRLRRSVFEVVTIVVAAALLANAAVPDARAVELVRGTSVITAVPAAEKTAAEKPAAEPPAESYQQRQDRIARSAAPLLPSAKDRPDETTCVSGEFTTLAVVYDSLVASMSPSLPPQVRAAVLADQPRIKREMQRITVSTLAISDHPKTLGASDDDPATKYRSPHSQAIISGLLKIRDGKQNEAIPVANITLSQAVETAWLYFFSGVLAPARLGVELAPNIIDLSGGPIESLSFVSYSMLLTIGFAVIRLGLTQVYSAISEAVLNQCVAQVTDEEKALAGAPSEDVVYDIPIHPIISSIADQLALADSDTCTPIGDLTLARIVTRTGEAAQAQAPNAAAKRQIGAETTRLLRQMRTVRIPHHLIPADPDDWNTVETMGSYIGGAIPFVGGAPLDILIGLGHNLGQGARFDETVSLHDLTVTKSLTAAYFSYHLAVHLFTTIGSALTEPIVNGGLTVSPFEILGRFLNLPLTYGLVTYHHVIRSMCLREDDTSGTGLGAEKKQRDYAAGVRTSEPSSSVKPRRSATPSTSASSRPAVSSSATSSRPQPPAPSSSARRPGR
ncbi:hypothetical protein [Gordonia caeni]|uniref:Uncharacterized protein n=1 Tax=Gordonia caeni TaxID=1007097 RepID=A0ABP7PAQ9_9ACTN